MGVIFVDAYIYAKPEFWKLVAANRVMFEGQ